VTRGKLREPGESTAAALTAGATSATSGAASPLSRETGGKGADPRALARKNASDVTQVLIDVALGKGGRNSAARVTAAMRVLELAGVLEEKPEASTERVVMVQPSVVAESSQLLAQERKRKLAEDT